jgi:hypothetical protein
MIARPARAVVCWTLLGLLMAGCATNPSKTVRCDAHLVPINGSAVVQEDKHGH